MADFITSLFGRASHDADSIASKMAKKLSNTNHPYYPVGSDIAGYVANDMPVLQLLASFFSGVAVIWMASYVLVTRMRPHLPRTELLTFLWFILCGFIHLFFEGYFAYNYKQMGSRRDLFGQLWKEYAYSDSRYMTKDAFVLCMETITAVAWGPLSFVVAGMIALDHPMRHSLQTVVSLGQLYGDVLYYATCTFDKLIYGREYSRPEAYYFYCYYIFMNLFWIVIPLILIASSARHISRATAALQKPVSNGRAKAPKKIQ